MRFLSILVLVIGIVSFVIGVYGGTLLSESTTALSTEQAIRARAEEGNILGSVAMRYRTLFIVAGGVMMMGGALLIIKLFRRFE